MEGILRGSLCSLIRNEGRVDLGLWGLRVMEAVVGKDEGGGSTVLGADGAVASVDFAGAFGCEGFVESDGVPDLTAMAVCFVRL